MEGRGQSKKVRRIVSRDKLDNLFDKSEFRNGIPDENPLGRILETGKIVTNLRSPQILGTLPLLHQNPTSRGWHCKSQVSEKRGLRKTRVVMGPYPDHKKNHLG